MAASFVTGQTVTASTTSGTGTLTTSAFAGSTTTGNLIVVGVSFDSGTLNTVTAVSDSKGNTYTKILDLDGAQDVTLWYAQNITGGASHTVTVTFNSGAGAALGFVAQEFTGVATSSALDRSVIAQGTSTTPASGNTASTTQADELVVGVLGFSGATTSVTLGTGYTNLGSVTGTNLSAALESKVVAATGVQAAGATLGASRSWCMGVATFRAAAAVSATTTSSSTVTAARTDTGAVSVSTTVGTTVTASATSPTTYYVSSAGSDGNNGLTTGTPWQTITKVNASGVASGSVVLFNGGDTFTGLVYLPNANVTLGSYGTGRATITNTTSGAVFAYDVGGITVRDLILSGGVGATVYDGLNCYNDTGGQLSGLTVSNVSSTGWANGLSIGGATTGFGSITITGSAFYSNRDAGIITYGAAFSGSNYANGNITITNCQAYSNLGNSGNTSSATGNGIVLGSVSTALVDLCSAYSNGANNAFTGAGPVGIWAYDSTAVTIQRSVAYNNSSGTIADGDGFDLDQNTSNSTIQYCLAYGNKGAGILLFAQPSTTTTTGNVVRYNLCWGNAKNTGLAYGELAVYGPVQSSTVFNNTLVARDNGTTNPVAVYVQTASNPSGVTIRNNILMSQSGNVVYDGTADAISKVLFQGNDYYSTNGGTLASWGGSSYSTLALWRATITGQEVVSAVNTGITTDPQLTTPASTPTVTDPSVLTGAAGLALLAASPAAAAGLDLSATFSTSVGTRDYFGVSLTSPYSIGAAERDSGAVSATTTVSSTVTATRVGTAAVSATTTAGSTVTAALTVGATGTTTVGSTVTAFATIAGFTFITVTGTYKNADGTFPAGKVTFTPTAAMRSTSAILEAGTVTGRLNGSGVVSVSLAATDDASTTPTGVTYLVVETITGAPTRSYNIAVPHSGGSLDLATAAYA